MFADDPAAQFLLLGLEWAWIIVRVSRWSFLLLGLRVFSGTAVQAGRLAGCPETRRSLL